MGSGALIFALLLGTCAAQPHAALDPPVTCFHCDDRARPFPGCLSEPVTCHGEEVCSIAYGTDLPTFKCQRAPDCDHLLGHHTALCEGGGIEIHPNQCQLCCKTDVCVQDIDRFLQQNLTTPQPVNQGVFCPGTCQQTNISACVHTATYCHKDQFCRVGINDKLMVAGQCENKREIQKCQEDQTRHPCVLGAPQAGHHAVCTWDCCGTTDCLTAHFGAYMAPVTTAVPVVTAAPTVASLAPTNPPVTASLIPRPVNCTKCDQFCRNNEVDVTCPEGFCSLTVEDGVGGSRTIKKECSNHAKCMTFFSEWSTNQVCKDILGNPLKTSNQDVSCTYCCSDDHCNVDLTKMSIFHGV